MTAGAQERLMKLSMAAGLHLRCPVGLAVVIVAYRQILHWFDLLASHWHKDGYQDSTESVCERGEYGVNPEPHLPLFVAAHVHRQLR